MSSQQKINIRNTVLILMIIAAAAMRLVSFKYQVLSNFTPVGAIAIFGGAYFTDKWKAYLVPFAALFVSDVLINYLYTSKLVFWYSSSVWVYLSFFVMVLFGTLIKKVNVINVILASVAGVAVHWLLTDIQPWLGGTLYNKNITGYFQSLVAAIPFELAKSRYTFLRTKRELAAA